MEAIATKKTILRLSTRNELEQFIETTHLTARFQDIAYGADGKPASQPNVTTVLKDTQSVRRVSVDRDFDGNLFITLEE